MKKLLLVAAGLLCVAGSAFAGANSGASAWLSWSATTQVTDTAGFAVQSNAYVRFTRTGGLSFKGGEVDLTWDPAGDLLGCFDHIATVYKTSAGTTCTYLNRGTALPVVTVDDPNHFHVAWANTSTLTGCTAGAGIQIGFETDGCTPSSQGCISLNSAILLDGGNLQDPCTIGNAIVTVDGGGSHHCQVTPVQPTTWGKIKSTFSN